MSKALILISSIALVIVALVFIFPTIFTAIDSTIDRVNNSTIDSIKDCEAKLGYNPQGVTNAEKFPADTWAGACYNAISP